MKCPACSAVVPDKSVECPGCGVDFAKWRARAEALSLGPSNDAPSPAAGTKRGLAPVLWMVICLAVGGSLAYVRSRVWKGVAAAPAAKAGQAAPAAPAQPARAAAPAAPAGSSATGDPLAERAKALAEELSAQAAEAGIPADEFKRYPEGWLREAEGFIRTDPSLSVERAAELGLPQFDTVSWPLEEIQQHGSKDFKCPSVPGIYLDRLPEDGSQVLECWRKLAGGGSYVQGYHETGTGVLMQTKFVGGGAYWERLYWQPYFKRWDSLKESDRLRERRLALEGQYGSRQQMEALQDYSAKKDSLAGDGLGLREAFNKAYKPRIIYELADMKLRSFP